MKKLTFKKIASLFLAFVVAIGTLAASSVSVTAKSSSWFIGISDTCWTETMYGFGVYNADNPDKEGKIKSVKSSNTKIFKVKKETYEYNGKKYTQGTLTPKKPGKAKLTVVFKTPSGKEQKLTQTITVKKYPYEINSLKVDGKTVKIKDYKFYYGKKTSKDTVKIKMALKDGWKIDSIYADRSKTGKTFKEFKVNKSALKNGTAIKFPKKYKYLWINVQLTNGKDYIHYSFDFYRK